MRWRCLNAKNSARLSFHWTNRRPQARSSWHMGMAEGSVKAWLLSENAVLLSSLELQRYSPVTSSWTASQRELETDWADRSTHSESQTMISGGELAKLVQSGPGAECTAPIWEEMLLQRLTSQRPDTDDYYARLFVVCAHKQDGLCSFGCSKRETTRHTNLSSMCLTGLRLVFDSGGVQRQIFCCHGTSLWMRY